jgi:crossover junction endodeoxyribonuclease RuvC
MAKIILGIDPGSNLLGYSVLRADSGKPRLVTMGVLDMRSFENQADKLKFIFEELQKLIQLYEPSDAAIEAPFYGKDVQAMLKLGRAQGAAMTAIACKGISVTEYSPRSIKKSVTGKGAASKEQVAAMLPHILEGDFHHKFMDATDAVGVAYCHYIQSGSLIAGKGKKYSGWGDFVKDNPDKLKK